SGAATFFHRAVIGAARRVRLDFVGRAPHDVHAAAVSLPAGNSGSVMFVGVSDAPVVLLFEIVVGQIRVTAAAQPELLDELLALFGGFVLQESSSLVRGNDVRNVLGQPLLVGVVQLFQGALHLALGFFVQFLRSWRGIRILRPLRKSWRQANGERENGCENSPDYP